MLQIVDRRKLQNYACKCKSHIKPIQYMWALKPGFHLSKIGHRDIIIAK